MCGVKERVRACAAIGRDIGIGLVAGSFLEGKTFGIHTETLMGFHSCKNL